MKIKSRNVTILQASIIFSEDNTYINYQANAELFVEGCAYIDLFTLKTIFDLRCNLSDMSNIQIITETQVEDWVDENYPEIAE